MISDSESKLKSIETEKISQALKANNILTVLKVQWPIAELAVRSWLLERDLYRAECLQMREALEYYRCHPNGKRAHDALNAPHTVRLARRIELLEKLYEANSFGRGIEIGRALQALDANEAEDGE